MASKLRRRDVSTKTVRVVFKPVYMFVPFETNNGNRIYAGYLCLSIAEGSGVTTDQMNTSLHRLPGKI